MMSRARIGLLAAGRTGDRRPIVPPAPPRIAEMSADAPFTMGESETPLIASRRLGPLLRLPRLELKLELRNPTGSWLDRAGVLAVARAMRLKRSRIAVVGDPDLALSVASYGARAGIGRIFISTPGVAPATVATLNSLGSHVIEVSADLERIERVAATAATRADLHFVGLADPIRAEALEQLGIELAEPTGSTPPDLVVLPCAAGDAANVARGIGRRSGSRLCAGEALVIPVDPSSVDPRDIRSAARLLAAEEGLLVGAPAAAATAALIRLARAKGFDRSARIVLVLSGWNDATVLPSAAERARPIRTGIRGLAGLLRRGPLASPTADPRKAATLEADGGLL
jgi:threonine synthase